MNKVPLAEGQCKGNLRDYTQHYFINYLPKENELNAKLEEAIQLKERDKFKSEYRSIRFTNTAQIKSFILGLIKGYFFFGLQNKEITNLNFRYKLDKFWKDVVKNIEQN